MKTLIALLTICFGITATGISAEPAKSPLTLTVKKQLLGSDHDMHGRQGSSQSKTFTLRVTLSNTSTANVEPSELSGVALLKRAREMREKVVKETLTPVAVKALKPNESITVDLGKIELNEVEWGKRKFEESLEEWQITCKQAGAIVGSAASSEKFATLEKEVTPLKGKGRNVPVPPRLKNR